MEDNTFSDKLDNNHTSLIPTPTYITLPISLPGAKLNDSQTVQIQVLNPNLLHQNNYQHKVQLGQIQIPLPSYQTNTTVLTVAYNNEEGEILCQNGFSEDMTVLAAIQPQDLQASEQVKMIINDDSHKVKIPTKLNDLRLISKHSEHTNTVNQQYCDTGASIYTKAAMNEFLVSDFLDKKSNETSFSTRKSKRKEKKKQSQAKNKRSGSVHIATALDGTTLYCCPECQMAYSEKDCLEKHLLLHKIERRFICDICGAGLKRKEHLERHKLGHNPERPYSCTTCGKGFKRKEHLNLHIVIHSGNKTEICSECGKGFYRKDHLRKHIKSHLKKQIKEQTLHCLEHDVL